MLPTECTLVARLLRCILLNEHCGELRISEARQNDMADAFEHAAVYRAAL